MRARLMLAILPAIAWFSLTQQKPLYTSALDGGAWTGGDLAIKKAYVAGFLDASEYHRVVLRELMKTSERASDYVKGFEENSPDIAGWKVDTIIEGVDKFYNDYRNRKIPAAGALRIVSLELTGHPAKDVEDATLKLRQLSSER